MGISTLFASAQSDEGAWKGVRIGYENQSLSNLFDLGGINVGVVKSWKITKDAPIYFEPGFELSWVHSSQGGERWDDWDDWDYGYTEKTSYDLIGINIPLNIAAKLKVADNLHIVPYIGADVKVYVYGNKKFTDPEDGYSESYNLFSGNDSFNRFNVGGHLGVDAHYQRYVFGFSYGYDFTKLQGSMNVHTSTLKVRVGLNF